MSDAEWYANNFLTGFTDTRGIVPGYRVGPNNTYGGAIPVEDVRDKLFDWKAKSAAVSYTYENSNGDIVTEEDPDRQGIIHERTGRPFGVFKMGYQIHQHWEWLGETSSNLLDTTTSDLGIANAVQLKGGAVAILQFQLPETITTRDGILMRPTLLAAGSLDGSLATTFALVNENVTCDNQMPMIRREYSTARYKHSKYSGFKLGDARDKVGILFDGATEFEEVYHELCNTKVSGKQFVKFLDFTVPIVDSKGQALEGKGALSADLKRDQLLHLWMSDPRVEPWMGTAYGIHQLMNTYNHHYVGTNGNTIRGERNMLSIASGATAKADNAVLDTLFDKVLV